MLREVVDHEEGAFDVHFLSRCVNINWTLLVWATYEVIPPLRRVSRADVGIVKGTGIVDQYIDLGVFFEYAIKELLNGSLRCDIRALDTNLDLTVDGFQYFSGLL